MKLAVYRIFSFLLLPIAILFSVAVLLFIRAAFANPPLFIGIFFAASISIYTYASLNFLIRGIDAKKLLGRSSKDWLIINALICLFNSLLFITQIIFLAINSNTIKNYAAIAKKNAGSALKLNEVQVIQFVNGLSYFFVVYGIVMLVHIIITFQYIKKYNFLLRNEQTPDS